MGVKCVYLESDAYLVCLTHALSTEREEIMGLLIGEIDENSILHISAVIMLRRSDKLPDRVEISPEQLSAASTEAERLARELGRPMRVLGWYHSHPHITVWPSHVDVRTQAMYQMMDEGFIGLIFSVFNEDKNTKRNKIMESRFYDCEDECLWDRYRIQVTCFQSVPNGSDYGRVEVPMHIVPSPKIGSACLQSLARLPAILTMEEEEAYQRTTQNRDLDLTTKIHNASVYTKSLCHVTDIMSGPVLQSLESRLERNKNRIESLKKEKEELLMQLEKT